MSLYSKLRTLFRKAQVEAELDEELRFHLEKQIEQNIARGMSAEEARYVALRTFGGVEQVKEECREAWGVRFIHELMQDVSFGLRQLRRNPGFTTVAVLTLALGIGANTAIFSVVNTILLRPLPYKNPSQLMMVWRSDLRGSPSRGTLSYPDFLDWRAQNDVFEHMAAFHMGVDLTLTGVGDSQRLGGAVVSANLFSLLGVKPALGRAFLPREDNHGEGGGLPVILSCALWKSRFGSNRDVIGKEISLNHKLFTVVGVMPPGFQFPIQAEHVDLWTTMALDIESAVQGPHSTADRSWRHLYSIARLKPNATIRQAQVEMNTIARRLAIQYPQTNADYGVWIQPALASVVGNVRPALLILIGAVGFVLLIACANAANLLLARLKIRQKEIAIRAALGAGRSRVVRQLLTESLLLAALGGLLGTLLAFWGTHLLVHLSPESFPRITQVSIDSTVLAFTAVVVLATGILFGLAPALHASKLNLTESFKEGWHGSIVGIRGHRTRSMLSVTEMALALVLLIGAGLLLKSLLLLHQITPGFEPSNALTFKVDLPEASYTHARQALFFQQLLSRLRALPGVQSAGAVNFSAFTGLEMTGDFQIAGRPTLNGQRSEARFCVITPGYFHTLRAQLLRGREFDPDDSSSAQPVAVINEALAQRYFQGQNPIGKRLILNSPAVIVGLVGNVRDGDMILPPEPTVYTPKAQDTSRGLPTMMTIVVRSATDPRNLISAVRGEVSNLDKAVPIYGVQTLDQYVSQSFAKPRFTTVLIGTFAGVALILAAVGVYGVMSYSVTQCTHEIGIRMALGAERRNILKLVLGQGLSLALIGIGIGIIGALALTRFLSSLLFGVKPTDPLTFIAVSLLLLGVALLACYIPARRATKVDPMVALRYE